MRTLNLPTEKAEVWKTGLPFYDAARLIGAAHLLFGTASVEVEDQGSRWVLRGPQLINEREIAQVAVISTSLGGRASGQLNDLVSTKLSEIRNYFYEHRDAPLGMGQRSESIGIYRQLESALQQGIRGIDPLAKYSDLASQSGQPFRERQEEFAIASAGAAFSAIANCTRNQTTETTFILPIIGEGHFVLSPLIKLRRPFNHAAGGFVAEVWASIEFLEEVVNRNLPVVDFAFRRLVETRTPVHSSSGYVGVDRVCRLMQKRKKDGEDFYFARQVRDYLSGTSSRNADPTEHDLARDLARFATTADVKHLESIVRLKARLMALDEKGQGRFARGRARRLFANHIAIQEVSEMIEQQADVPEGMTWALARWFTGGGKEGWIGQFIKLENASSADRFLDESERILSRARMYSPDEKDPHFQRHRRDSFFYSYSASPQEQDILNRIRGLGGPRFRSLKAVFLLDLQAKMTYEGRRSAAPAQDAAEATQGGEQ